MSPKRQNREGTFTRRADGTWHGKLGYTDDSGAYRRISVYGASRGEVRAKLLDAAGRLSEGQPPKDSRLTVAAWAETWATSTLAASSRRPSTKALTRSIIAHHIAPTTLGNTSLARLRPSHVDAWTTELRARTRTRAETKGGSVQVRALSDATISRAFRVLRLVLDGAVRDGLIARNPAAAAERPRLERKEARVLSPEQVARIINAAGEMDALRLERGGFRTHHRALFALIATTGIRKGEALALRWPDVDLDNGTITIRGTLARVGGQLTVSAPKTRASRRVLAPSARVIELLRAHQAAQAEDRQRAAEGWTETGHVFVTAAGKPIDPRSALRAFTQAAERAGVPGVSVHTLRHSAATAMLDKGIHLKAVSETLGHAGTQVTAEVYAHLTTRTARAAMDALGDILEQ